MSSINYSVSKQKIENREAKWLAQSHKAKLLLDLHKCKFLHTRTELFKIPLSKEGTSTMFNEINIFNVKYQ